MTKEPRIIDMWTENSGVVTIDIVPDADDGWAAYYLALTPKPIAWGFDYYDAASRAGLWLHRNIRKVKLPSHND